MQDIEICELSEDKVAGRMKIKMSALTINNEGEYNRRGMTWLEEYVQNNLDSIIGAPYVVSWLDDNKTIPSDHGRMSYDEDGNVQYEGENVGTIQKAYIEDVEIDGQVNKRLVTEGYLFTQRTPNFIKFLKEELATGEHIKGSIEINGKGDSKTIDYRDGSRNEDGSWKMGRIPTVFDFAGLAILYLATPADSGSEIIEINTINDIPSDNKSDEYIKSTNSKEEINTMEKDTTQDVSVVELNNVIVEKVNEINSLTQSIQDKDVELNACKGKIEELNAVVVEANKTIETLKTEATELNTEIEPLRELKAKQEVDKKQTEINTYFENIKTENGFSTDEVSMLEKEYVEKCDFEGLKTAEIDLCVKKFKEMKKNQVVESEINSIKTDDNLFFSTKTEKVETNSTNDGSELFA